MRIYLDNCCFNRPFDDQSQIRIRLETEAKLNIQANILQGKFELIWSYILEAENTANPFMERTNTISEWKRRAVCLIKENEKILELANKFRKHGIHSKDALHIACAIAAECTYFLTTDDKVLKKNSLIDEISIIDPIDFIKEVHS